jgi:hypothetical protein
MFVRSIEVDTVEDLIDYLWPKERSKRLSETLIRAKIAKSKTVQPSELLTLKTEEQEKLF